MADASEFTAQNKKHHKHSDDPAPILYLIRHGEKPPKVDGEDQDGLSAQGLTRAQGLRTVFGASSPYNIKYIMAQHPKKDGGRARPFETIQPLSQDLDIKPNTKIDRDDVAGAAETAKAFKGPGNLLLCWEHGVLEKIAEALIATPDTTTPQIVYPSSRFDLIWKVYLVDGVWTFEEAGSEGVPGLDDPFLGGNGQSGVLPVKSDIGVAVSSVEAA